MMNYKTHESDARNPEPDDVMEYPLDDVDWDLPYVNLCDYEVYKQYLDKYVDPIRHFEKDSTRFYIHPDFPGVVRHSNQWIEDVVLEDYDDGVSSVLKVWERAVEDIKYSAYRDFDEYQEAMRESHGGSLDL